MIVGYRIKPLTNNYNRDIIDLSNEREESKMMIAGDKNMITIANQCPFCGKEYTFKVPTEGYDKYMAGALVQNTFPELSATEREYFVSGICETCQKKVFGEEEEDDEDLWEDEIYND